MKKIFSILLLVFLTTSVFATDFVNQFLKECAENNRSLSNINIGRGMLKKMAANTQDEQMKTALQNLNSIRIITTDNKKDSQYYYDKAKDLVFNKFSDYSEVVSIDERKSKINILIKKLGEKNQDLILIALDDDAKLTIITIAGNIDFNSISKLSSVLREDNTSEIERNEELKNTN